MLRELDIVEAARSGQYDLIAFTANATITKSSKLVMGRGAAKVVRDAFSPIDFQLGCEILRRTGSAPGEVAKDYHIVTATTQSGIDITAVQVKRHFRDQDTPTTKYACLELTRQSLAEFNLMCKNRGLRAAINYPLIGNAGFVKSEVETLVESTLTNPNIDLLIK